MWKETQKHAAGLELHGQASSRAPPPAREDFLTRSLGEAHPLPLCSPCRSCAKLHCGTTFNVVGEILQLDKQTDPSHTIRLWMIIQSTFLLVEEV